MQPTTLARAIEIAEKVFPGSMRETLVDKINEVRDWLWKDGATRELYFQANGCECVVCMTDPCAGGRCSLRTYSAIVLPAGLHSLRKLEIDGREIQLSSQRLPNSGCMGGCDPCVKAELLPVRSFLKHPIPKGYKGKLLFRNSHPDDTGKRVGIEYLRHNGQVIREDVLLSQEGAPTSHSPSAVLALTLPERCGVVDVLTQEFFNLGSYRAGIIAPQHMVVRLQGARTGQLIRWEALQEPWPVRYDTDIVEISSELDWKNFFQTIQLHFKQEKSASEVQTYRDSVALGRALNDSALRASQTVPIANLKPTVTQRFRRTIGWLQSRRIR